MTTPNQKAGKSSRGWGSIWQGAVAGLESRLDTILAEDGSATGRQGQTTAQTRQGTLSVSRTSSPANTNTPQRTESPARPSLGDGGKQSPRLIPTSADRARSNTPDLVTNPRTSTETAASDVQASTSAVAELDAATGETELQDVESSEPQPSQTHKASMDTDSLDVSSGDPAQHSSEAPSSQPQINAAEFSAKEVPLVTAHIAEETKEDLRAQLTQAKEDFESLELQRQEELHSNLERIDALQAKLQYLSKEAVESAKQAASEASDDSPQRKLALKDEQIALLLEEGQKLSKSEVTQATTIRKLRSKMLEDAKLLTEAKRKASKQEEELYELANKISFAENNQRDTQMQAARLYKLEQDVATLRAERDEVQATNESLRKQLDGAQKRAEEEQRQTSARALDEEKKIAQSLRDDLSNAKIEKKLVEDRAKQDLSAKQEELDREKERGNASEMGLRNEISIMEGRLEVLRVKTEEASTGTTNDSQAKLLRQIETLQSQYAFASENWQGIESSLQSRLTAVEKERDDAVKQEAETRKKVRGSSNSARRIQEQFEESSRRSQLLEHELNERKEDVEKSQLRVSELEKQLSETEAGFERERQSWNARLASRVEEERTKWRQETPIESSFGRMDSPSMGHRKHSGLELPTPTSRRTTSRHPSTDIGLPHLTQPISRRSSYHPSKQPEVMSPNGHDSGRSTPFLNGLNIPQTPSVHAMDADDMMETSSSPQRTVNDIMSSSTAAAGPSVQLVERMSATVRRLESEKAANKEEMLRISAQRDEARQEIVSLMSEIEQKRAVDAKVTKLEKELADVNQRYQTTLEMLGEKSEKVDELEADIVEYKQMCRDLQVRLVSNGT